MSAPAVRCGCGRGNCANLPRAAWLHPREFSMKHVIRFDPAASLPGVLACRRPHGFHLRAQESARAAALRELEHAGSAVDRLRSDQCARRCRTRRIFAAALAGIHASVGAIKEVTSENVSQERGMWVYHATCRFESTDDALVLLIALTPEGRIAGLAVRPEQKEFASNEARLRRQDALELPFQDEWYVFWGGPHAQTELSRGLESPALRLRPRDPEERQHI